MNRKINIFIKDLQENDSEIMPDPPVKYLQNNKYNQIYQVLTTTFIYYDWTHLRIMNQIMK